MHQVLWKNHIQNHMSVELLHLDRVIFMCSDLFSLSLEQRSKTGGRCNYLSFPGEKGKLPRVCSWPQATQLVQAFTPCPTLLSSWGARIKLWDFQGFFKHINYVYVNLYVYLYVNRCTQLQMKLRSSLMERKAALPTFLGHLWGNPEAPTKSWIPFPPPLLRKHDSASGQQLPLIKDVKSYHGGLDTPPCQGSQPPTTDFWGWISLYGASLAARMVKNLPAMQKTRVRDLGWEYSLEKAIATHCSILAWRIPWTEEPDGLQSMGLQSQAQLTTNTQVFTGGPSHAL